MEFYSQNDGFARAEKGIGEFHPLFFFTAFKDNVWGYGEIV